MNERHITFVPATPNNTPVQHFALVCVGVKDPTEPGKVKRYITSHRIPHLCTFEQAMSYCKHITPLVEADMEAEGLMRCEPFFCVAVHAATEEAAKEIFSAILVMQGKV